MMEYLSQSLEIGDALAGAVVVMVLYHRIIVGPLKKRIIYLEEESQEILDEVYTLSQRSQPQYMVTTGLQMDKLDVLRTGSG